MLTKNKIVVLSIFITFNICGGGRQLVEFMPRLKINSREMATLICHARTFLDDNGHRLCQYNESGFVRFNIPTPAGFDSRVEKLRLNYWPDKKGENIDPETIHYHPRYFRSLVISGGYRHSIYASQQGINAVPYDLYRIYKPTGKEKKFMHIGKRELCHIGDENINRGDYIGFPPKVIHRILSTKPGTLSMNLVDKIDGEQEYGLYLTPGSPLELVKTEREFLSEAETSYVVSRVIEHMEAFQKDLE